MKLKYRLVLEIWLKLKTFWPISLLEVCLLIHIIHTLIHSLGNKWSNSRSAKQFFAKRGVEPLDGKRRPKDIMRFTKTAHEGLRKRFVPPTRDTYALVQRTLA